MRTFAQRRYGNIAIASVGALAIFALNMSRPPLVRQHSLTGWILTVGVVFLVLLNARKKVPVLPLLAAATWLQMHIYVGLVAAVVFVMHTGLRYPDGWFNQILWWFFVGLTISGVAGICGERLIARHLRDRGEAVLFNRITAFRVRLAGEAEALARRSAVELGSPLLVDFYCGRLAPFMAKTRHFWSHLLAIRAPTSRLSREMRELERYLNPRGRETLHEIEERVQAKDNLDHQYALASVMRVWLFLHIPLAYGVLLLIGVHIVLVYAFGGF
jgi:hypothetical protein